MVWNHSVATKTACVRTAHTLHLNLKVCVARSGRVCGVATHAVGGNAGYGLLYYSLFIKILWYGESTQLHKGISRVDEHI